MTDGNGGEGGGGNRREFFARIGGMAATAVLPAAAQTAPVDDITDQIAKGIIARTQKKLDAEKQKSAAMPSPDAKSGKDATRAALSPFDDPDYQYSRALSGFSIEASRSFARTMTDEEVALMQGRTQYEQFLNGQMPKRTVISAAPHYGVSLGTVTSEAVPGVEAHLSGYQINNVTCSNGTSTYIGGGTLSGSEIKNHKTPSLTLWGNSLFNDFSGLETDRVEISYKGAVYGNKFNDAKIKAFNLYSLNTNEYGSSSYVKNSSFDNAEIDRLFVGGMLSKSSFTNARIKKLAVPERGFGGYLIDNAFINATFDNPGDLTQENLILDGTLILSKSISDPLGVLAKKGAMTTVGRMNEVMGFIINHYTNVDPFPDGIRFSLGYLRRSAEPLLFDPLMRPLANDKERSDLAKIVTFLDKQYPEIAEVEGVPNISTRAKGPVVGG